MSAAAVTHFHTLAAAAAATATTITASSRRSFASAIKSADILDDVSKIGQHVALQHTALYDAHVARNATMVPFAGYMMPVQYKGLPHKQNHAHVRESAGLFDVSHMGQFIIRGTARVAFLETLVVGDIMGMADNTSVLSLMCNEQGGVIDDTIVTVKPDHIFMVVNGACKSKDFAHVHHQLALFNAKQAAAQADAAAAAASTSASSSEPSSPMSPPDWEEAQYIPVTLESLPSSTRSLLALQGPLAATVMQRLVGLDVFDFSAMQFMQHTEQSLRHVVDVPDADTGSGTGAAAPHHPPSSSSSIPCWITRCGYTGEDGFEVSVESARAVELFELLLAQSEVQVAGLATRDTLRLEAGLCLYGQDLDERTTPVESSLTWTIPKCRRLAPRNNFVGADIVLRQCPRAVDRVKPVKKRVGLYTASGAPPRAGVVVKDAEHNAIGVITSGTVSPTLGKNIAMASVAMTHAKVGTEVVVDVRGKHTVATVVKTPFVESRYYKLDN